MAVHLAKGVRDYLPAAMRHREGVMATVAEVFQRYGFESLGTPAFERLDTLAGKYGDEGEKLMYRILARGEEGKKGKADLALRYDLTVPLARFVAMHKDLRLPFKRYQMAPVWRADRPQRGRFREFWQCDVDIVGTTSTLADAECVAVCADALAALGFGEAIVRVNDRRILRAIARAAGAHDREMPLLITVDKLDKIGRDGVTTALSKIGVDDAGMARMWSILDVPQGREETLDALDASLDEEGRAGVATLRDLLTHVSQLGIPDEAVRIDPTLARGLDYYTGPVFEAVAPGRAMGSIAGGGRYDGLVGMFSGKDVPAVGVSLGLERLITLLEEEAAEAGAQATAEVLVTVHDPAAPAYAVAVATALRQGGVRTELYLDARKLKAQLKHANARGYRWVAFTGPEEEDAGSVKLKDFRTGAQEVVPLKEAASWIRSR